MYTIEDIREAYYKLKNYIYYDNSEILLREKLIEFETDTFKDEESIFRWGISSPYSDSADLKNIFDQKENSIQENLDIKFNKLLEELNNNNINSKYFKYLFKKIDVSFFLKKFKEDGNDLNKNFISNVKTKENYEVEKVTPFINAPLEFHIISVLWIIKTGYQFDSQLLDACKGNRLLLNKDKNGLIHNSSLFKPYYSQYQSWRDDSVIVAQDLISKNKNALFVNLDIKNYFNSVTINLKDYFANIDDYPVNNILSHLHDVYNTLLVKKYKVLNGKSTSDSLSTVLPIGLLSSYVIANHYLDDFDKILVKKIKPAYYSRYVDDILIVVSEPKDSIEDNKTYGDYIIKHSDYVESESKIEADYILTTVEKFIIENLSPIFRIQIKDNERIIKIDKYENLICQQEKTLMYFFDHNESDIVIDKLKQELNYRSSEFKDLPDDNESLGDFDKNALYLNYTDSDGKIRTLKDYKENRFGLTVYLTNKILGTIKHKKNVSDDEVHKLLKIFKGQNCLDFYKLWEKILTYLLVNNKPKEYVQFYFDCIEEIKKIKKNRAAFSGTRITSDQIQDTLIKYLDSSHELTLSLNLNFIDKHKDVKFNFEFNSDLIEAHVFDFFFNQITRSNSIWALRYRKSNMMRHQYVSFPLLNYTKNSYSGYYNLIDNNINLEKYEIDDELLSNSPRPVKFWECTVSKLITDLNLSTKEDELNSKISDYYDDDESVHFLDQAFERFKIANTNHKPEYILNNDKQNLKDDFFILQKQKDNLLSVRVNANCTAKLLKPKISVANTFVDSKNIVESLRGKTNVTNSRYQDLVNFLKSTRKNNSDIVIFPEFFIPIQLLSSLVRYTEKNDSLIISGLEHITINGISYNFVATILPIDINGYKDATIFFRLKNHYAPVEEDLILGNHLKIPKPKVSRYHVFNWKNLYFSVFYCFELSNILHRSALRGKVDLLVAVEYNKDIPYFSNIVETTSRDLHCFIAQVNSSHYGDTRICQPVESYRKDIIKIKGGENNCTIVGTIEVDALREFQRKKYNLTKNDKSFKVLPPDFKIEDVLNRINNM